MVVDVAVLIVVAAFAVFGFVRGLFSQLWSVASIHISFFAAGPTLQIVRQALGMQQDDSLIGEWILRLIAGLGLFIVLLLAGFFVEKAFVERFKVLSTGNRLFGATLGAVKGGIVVVVLLWITTFLLPLIFPNSFAASAAVPAKSDTGKSPASSTTQNDANLADYLAESHAVAAIDPYNPLNLLLLARIKPYLPQEMTGSQKAPIKPPKALESNAAFQALLQDAAFTSAYRDRDYLDIMLNPCFHQLVKNRELVRSLEKTR